MFSRTRRTIHSWLYYGPSRDNGASARRDSYPEKVINIARGYHHTYFLSVKFAQKAIMVACTSLHFPSTRKALGVNGSPTHLPFSPTLHGQAWFLTPLSRGNSSSCVLLDFADNLHVCWVRSSPVLAPTVPGLILKRWPNSRPSQGSISNTKGVWPTAEPLSPTDNRKASKRKRTLTCFSRIALKYSPLPLTPK